ncbi:MAG: beta-mannanase [Patiriisocius sp.]|jgi:beta-mannanase
MERQVKLYNCEMLQNLNVTKIIKQFRIVLFVAALINPIRQFLFAQEKKELVEVKSNPTIAEMLSEIKTQVNPEYVYKYEKTKFVPPNGKTLLIMGQTVESINEYLNHFPDEKKPSGWSAYWGIPEFKAITESYKNKTGGTQNHQMLIDSFPNTVVQSAMWMVGKWDVAKKARKGDYDKVVKQYAAWAKTTNRPIYLRIGYEFDGIHNELEPKEYVKAYRRIVDLIRAEGAENIAFVWHSYASKTYKDYPLSNWYPGDDYVDWVGISVFGHAYGGDDFGTYCDTVLKFAKQCKKPIIIAESNPIFGIEKDNIDAWNKWFVNFFTFAYNKNIKAISFINEDWSRTAIDGISEWKDGRLYNNEKISKAWFMETNKDRYLKQSPELFEMLGYDEKN